MRAIVTLLLIAATACGASARDKVIHATLVATNASREAFVTYDERHQLAITEDATSEADGIAKLDAYKAKRDRVAAAFEGLYRAIAIATVLQHDAKSLDNITTAAKILRDEIKALTGGTFP